MPAKNAAQKPQHSPLPWKVIHGDAGGLNPVTYILGSNSRAVTAPIPTGYPVGSSEAETIEADARLIVRAVNAHEALVAATKAALEDAEEVLATLPKDPASPGRDTEWARWSRRANGYRAALVLAQEDR